MNEQLHFETKAIQSTLIKEEFASVTQPIYLTTTYERGADGSYAQGFIYSRMDNPNRKNLEETIALLENGKRAFAFASGMAAINAIFQSLQAGDHVILPDDAYYTAELLLTEVYGRWGLQHSKVDMSDLTAVKKAVTSNTKLIWVETPSNPQLKISDIEAIAAIAHENNAWCVVDNTWGTPVFQLPLMLGADAVMHSSTKYFGGHCDVIGGAVVVKENEALINRLEAIQRKGGAVPSPFDCWMISRGIKTLSLRVKAQAQNAFHLATFLATHPKIEKVNYPGLSLHPQHTIAAKQMKNGFGAMLSVQIKGNAEDAMQLTGRLQLFTTATSLGGVESLVEHRRSVEGPYTQTPENLLRISVGIEHIDDLINDWKQALD